MVSIEGSDGTDYFAHISKKFRLKATRRLRRELQSRLNQEMEKKDQVAKQYCKRIIRHFII